MTMKAMKLGAILGCVLAAMAACSPSPEASTDAGSNSRDAGKSTTSDAGLISLADAGCNAGMALILGRSCMTCVQTNCQDQIASCSFDECTKCLLSCTACTSACTSSGADSGTGGDGSVPSDSDGGVPSSGGGTPSCDKIRNGNCCSLIDSIKQLGIDPGSLGAQCQQLVDTNNEELCSKLLTNTQNFFNLCQ
jgi:hypothetical protein